MTDYTPDPDNKCRYCHQVLTADDHWQHGVCLVCAEPEEFVRFCPCGVELEGEAALCDRCEEQVEHWHSWFGNVLGIDREEDV